MKRWKKIDKDLMGLQNFDLVNMYFKIVGRVSLFDGEEGDQIVQDVVNRLGRERIIQFLSLHKEVIDYDSLHHLDLVIDDWIKADIIKEAERRNKNLDKIIVLLKKPINKIDVMSAKNFKEKASEKFSFLLTY